MTRPESDLLDYDEGDECSNCGGEGIVYDCIDGQCLNADEGCDLCGSRCDWCRPAQVREGGAV